MVVWWCSAGQRLLGEGSVTPVKPDRKMVKDGRRETAGTKIGIVKLGKAGGKVSRVFIMS